jgi:hypothetical protein
LFYFFHLYLNFKRFNLINFRQSLIYTPGKRIIGATNRINPLNQDTELNLRAISRFLITNPEARIRFQYPTIPKSQHPNVQSDMKSIYDMSFSQITNHLRTQGVENLNQRVLRSSGSDFNVFLDD